MINYTNIISTQEKIATKLENDLFTNITQNPLTKIELIDPNLDLTIVNKKYLVSKLTNIVLTYPQILTFLDNNTLKVKLSNLFNDTKLSDQEAALSKKIITFDLSKENALKSNTEIEKYIQNELMNDAEIDEEHKQLKLTYSFLNEQNAIAITSWASQQENIDLQITNQNVTLIIK